MQKKLKVAICALLFASIVIASWVFVSTQNIAVLNPKGMIGIKQKELLVTATWLMMIVVIPVYIMTLLFAWRYREKNTKAKYTPDWEHNHLAEVLWWGIPFVIILALAIITWKSSHSLDPSKPIASDKKTLTIQAVALDWKWLFIYPEQGIATVNWVQFPEKTPIHFEISADAPMNSFWIPELGGQIYAMPAMKTELYLIADETGSFKGLSSNISGVGFAGMTFTAKASSLEDFDAWVEEVKHSPKALTMAAYEELARPSSYDPVSLYTLEVPDLFDRIVMKGMDMETTEAPQ